MDWIKPKTDWKVNDRFNIRDYNRIKNNLSFLAQKASTLIKPFYIEDMGEDITDYKSSWKADDFNKFERNLEKINENTYGIINEEKQTFFENGVFIQFGELNRIESATLNINDMMDRQKSLSRRLGFKLGRFKKVRT